jgi:hypothetical protein
MPRQRLRTRTSALALVGRILVVLLALALVWAGLMLLLLALGVDPGTVDMLSGYRRAYDFLAGLGTGDVSDRARLVAAIAGVLAFLCFGYLALKEIPRPYLSRHELELGADERGTIVVEPRAIERVAEAAAAQHPAVAGAAGRYGGDDLALQITVRRAREVPETLADVQARVVAALERHGLPVIPVNLTLAGFERRTRRELD